MPITGRSRNIFTQARDALTNKDEKEAMESALKEVDVLEDKLEAAEKNVASLNQRLMEATKRAAEAEARAAAAEKKLAESQSSGASSSAAKDTELKELRSRLLAAESRLKLIDARESRETAAADAAAKALLAEHTLKADETLSHLALKYYGSGYEPYWRVIYEANKELIGDNPGRVRPGMVIKVPQLPDELKNK